MAVISEKLASTFDAFANAQGHLTAEAFSRALQGVNINLAGQMNREGFTFAATALDLNTAQSDAAFAAFDQDNNGFVDISAIVGRAAQYDGNADGALNIDEFGSFLAGAQVAQAQNVRAEADMVPASALQAAQAAAHVPLAEPAISSLVATDITPKIAPPLGGSSINFGIRGGPALNYILDLTSNWPQGSNLGVASVSSPDGNILNPENTVSLSNASLSRVTPATASALEKLSMSPFTSVSFRQGDLLNNDLSNPSFGLGLTIPVSANKLALPNIASGKPYPLDLGNISFSLSSKKEYPASLLNDMLTGNSTLSGSYSVSATASLNLTGAAALAVASIPGGQLLGVEIQGSQQIASLMAGETWSVKANFKDGQFTGFTMNGSEFDPYGAFSDMLKKYGLTGNDLAPMPVIRTDQGVFPGGLLPGEVAPPTPQPNPNPPSSNPGDGSISSDRSYTTPDGVTHFYSIPDANDMPSETIDGVTHFYPPGYTVPNGTSTGANRGRLIASSGAPIPPAQLAQIAQQAGVKLGEVRAYHDTGNAWNYFVPMPQTTSTANNGNGWPLGTMTHKPTQAELSAYAANFKVPISSLSVKTESVNGKTWWNINAMQKPTYPGGTG